MGFGVFLLLLLFVAPIIWGTATVIRAATENPVDDGAREVARFHGSKLLGASTIDELIFTDQYVMSRRWEGSGYIKRKIYYSDIAQINVKKGLIACEVEIVNRGEGPNARITGLPYDEAVRVQQMLDAHKADKMDARNTTIVSGSHIDDLERLATLMEKGILSREEFEREKSRILAP